MSFNVKKHLFIERSGTSFMKEVRSLSSQSVNFWPPFAILAVDLHFECQWFSVWVFSSISLTPWPPAKENYSPSTLPLNKYIDKNLTLVLFLNDLSYVISHTRMSQISSSNRNK